MKRKHLGLALCALGSGAALSIAGYLFADAPGPLTSLGEQLEIAAPAPDSSPASVSGAPPAQDAFGGPFCACVRCESATYVTDGTSTGSTCQEAAINAEMVARSKIPASCTVCWQYIVASECTTNGQGQPQVTKWIYYKCCTEFATC